MRNISSKLITGLLIFSVFLSSKSANQAKATTELCPQTGDWVKDETSPFSVTHESKNVAQVCIKGSTETVYFDALNPSNNCWKTSGYGTHTGTAWDDHLGAGCHDISHASFRFESGAIPTATPTLISTPTPTATPVPIATPTPTCEPTATPTPTPTTEPEVTPTPDKEEPTPTPTSPPTGGTDVTDSSSDDNSNDSSNNSSTSSEQTSTGGGEVLGVTTLADTNSGIVESLGWALTTLGSLLTGATMLKSRKEKKS
jgi:hypothetical protein